MKINSNYWIQVMYRMTVGRKGLTKKHSVGFIHKN